MVEILSSKDLDLNIFSQEKNDLSTKTPLVPQDNN